MGEWVSRVVSGNEGIKEEGVLMVFVCMYVRFNSFGE